MDVLKDLALLIDSRYPIIAVETYEEERLEEALQQIAEKLGVPLFVWTITEGLRRTGGDPIYDSRHPLKALGNLAAMRDGIYLFKDLQRHLGEAEVVRKLQDLARSFAKKRRAIVLSATEISLPAELEKLAAFFKLDLPTPEELKLLAKNVVRDLSRQHKIHVELSPADFDRLAEGLRGLTLFEAERALTKAVLHDLALTGKDLDRILEVKKELLEKEGILEYSPPEEMAQVGGLQTLKKWLEKRRKAFEPEAKQFGIEPPKGILLLGVQGCLRGDTRVLLGDGRMPTFETLARQASDCLEPGVYDVAYRVALEDGTTAMATDLQIHQNRETVLLKFADGRELEATYDHELLTTHGWRRAGEIATGDDVLLWNRQDGFATPAKRTGFGRPLHSVRKRRAAVDVLPEIWTPELAELIGLVTAEGCQDRYRVTITLSEDEHELADWLRQRADKLFGVALAEQSRWPKRVRQFRFNSFDVAVNLHPLVQGTKRTKAVPDPIFQLDDACVAAFLRGLFEGDGTVANSERGLRGRRSPRVELKTASSALAQGVQLLLQRLGIFSRIVTQTTVHGYSRYPIHTVVVQTRTSLEQFASAVGFISERKQARLKRGLASFSRRTRPRNAGMARVAAVETGRVLDRVYDLSVPGAERFIANGLVVHNCGKSLAAKVVAKEWGLPFLKLEPGRLYDKYIGESEKNLDKALRTAERMAPCVLMIDEIEKGFAFTGSSEADAGLSRRIVGRLFGWLQDRTAPVFVVATCNQLAQLPPELTRKGRFDEIFFIDLPRREERTEIFSVHLRKRKRDPSAFDLDALADASEGFSGAEIEQAVVSGLYTAFSHGGDLTTQLLLEELTATKPLSVTRKEEIAALRQWAEGRTVMAS